MLRNLIILLGSAILLAFFGCSSGEPSNANSNSRSNANTNSAIKLDPANMPPGLSANALPPSANMPAGIPANGTALPPGKTPTPGIPSAEEIKKGFKPGKTPTPGIPDPATIRKQMGLPGTNVNTPPKPSDVPMMKSNKKPPGKP